YYYVVHMVHWNQRQKIVLSSYWHVIREEQGFLALGLRATMSQQPKTETDRLASVIQVIQLGQKTGRLIVERTNGSSLEQGAITFASGQITQASIGQHQGNDALTLLSS